MKTELQHFIDEVKEELNALKDFLTVPKAAYKHAEELTESEMNMSGEDTADMCISLSL